MKITEPRVKIAVQLSGNRTENLSYEGEKPKELMDAFTALIGDGKAGVSVSTDFSVKSFGNGVSAMVTVSLTCNQDQATLNATAELASQAARYYARKFQGEGERELREKLLGEGRKAEF